MNNLSDLENIIKEVRENLDLSLGDLLNLLRQRVILSNFQLAIIAGVDTGAFNKIVNSREGRLLHHDEIARLVLGLDEEKQAFSSQDEIKLWLMALQSAATADAQIALMKRYNRVATEAQFRLGRRTLVTTMRQLWVETGGALGVAPPRENKVVLNWRERPRDLDLYLKIRTDEGVNIISYRNMGSLDSHPFAMLDIDVRNGLGPETITVQKLTKGKYHYAVHNCSNESRLAGSGATVTFEYTGQDFKCPEEGNGQWWSVFIFDTTTGNVEIINQIVEVLWDDDAGFQRGIGFRRLP